MDTYAGPAGHLLLANLDAHVAALWRADCRPAGRPLCGRILVLGSRHLDIGPSSPLYQADCWAPLLSPSPSWRLISLEAPKSALWFGVVVKLDGLEATAVAAR